MKLFDQKWKWAVAFIVLFGTIFILYGLYTYFFWTCCSEPIFDEAAFLRLKESCQSEGGFFVEPLEICQLPTEDAGKSCANSSECEGFCEAELSPDEISRISGGGRIEKIGKCGEWKNFASGCFYVVEDGIAERLCAD